MTNPSEKYITSLLLHITKIPLSQCLQMINKSFIHNCVMCNNVQLLWIVLSHIICSIFECSPFSHMLKPYEQHCFVTRSHYFMLFFFPPTTTVHWTMWNLLSLFFCCTIDLQPPNLCINVYICIPAGNCV